jgi:photosystem II stability/assembly factor-like uncharacterized protein
VKLLTAGAVAVALAASIAGPMLRGHAQIPDFAAIRREAPVAFGFFDHRRGVIARGDGRLLATWDAGRSWRVQGRPSLGGIDVVSSSTAYATRGRWLLRTDDAGASWRIVVRAAGALSFADRLHGWIDEGSRVLATNDGGRTLYRLHAPCTQDPSSTRALSRVTATLGFAACAGVGGTGNQLKWLYVTHDAGRSWRLQAGQKMPEPGYLTSIRFTSARDGLLAAYRGGVAATHDGGRIWRWILSMDEGASVEPLPGSAARSVLALLGDGPLFRSDDRGRHWHLLYPGTQPSPDQVSFTSANDGIGFGYDWTMTRRQVVATHDSGRSWQLRRLLPQSLSPYSLARVTRRIVYLGAGSYQRIGEDLYRSSDDGRTWTHVNTPGGSRFFAVSFTSVLDGVLADHAGRFYVTHDGARTWSLVHGTGEDLRTFVFLTRTPRVRALSGARRGPVRDAGRSSKLASVHPDRPRATDRVCRPRAGPHLDRRHDLSPARDTAPAELPRRDRPQRRRRPHLAADRAEHDPEPALVRLRHPEHRLRARAALLGLPNDRRRP